TKKYTNRKGDDSRADKTLLDYALSRSLGRLLRETDAVQYKTDVSNARAFLPNYGEKIADGNTPLGMAKTKGDLLTSANSVNVILGSVLGATPHLMVGKDPAYDL